MSLIFSCSVRLLIHVERPTMEIQTKHKDYLQDVYIVFILESDKKLLNNLE
jgi:hypothetical protein